MDRPVRVLVVDDSAFARKVVREVLSTSPRIEVVDIARDGLEALEKIAELHPDVVTLDLVMPNLDGIGVLKALPAEGAPRVVVVSISDMKSELGVEALQLGAVDLVQKPTALATDRLYELSGELVKKVLAAAAARTTRPVEAGPPLPLPAVVPSKVRLVVVGTSTGGPQAMTRLLTRLPADFPVPIALALHIPRDYTASLAARLDGSSALRVVEADEGTPLVPGSALIARGSIHLKIRSDSGALKATLDRNPAASLHHPSVDVLFESAAQAVGGAVLGVVLTGMGDDGLEGARAISKAGGRVLTESESSCVVYGMPRAVAEAGLSSGEAPIDRMAELLMRHL